MVNLISPFLCSHLRGRCKYGATCENLSSLVYETVFELFSCQIHRRNLRFGQSLDVAGLSDLDVAVTQNRLDLFVRNSERVKIRYQSAAEGVPPSPHGDVEHLLDVGAAS